MRVGVGLVLLADPVVGRRHRRSERQVGSRPHGSDEAAGPVPHRWRQRVGGPVLRVAVEHAEMRQAGADGDLGGTAGTVVRSEEHTSELQSLMRISYAVFCLQKNNTT